MSTLFHVTIDVSKHASDPSDALGFRHGFEDAIEEHEIGEVVGGGTMLDGSSVDVSFATKDVEKAAAFLEDYLNHCGVFEDTKITQEPNA